MGNMLSLSNWTNDANNLKTKKPVVVDAEGDIQSEDLPEPSNKVNAIVPVESETEETTLESGNAPKVANNGASTVTNNGASTVTNNGASTVTNNDASTVTNNDASTVTNNGQLGGRKKRSTYRKARKSRRANKTRKTTRKSTK